MNLTDFEKRIMSVPAVEPDAIDLAMIVEADAVNDGTAVSLEEYKKR